MLGCGSVFCVNFHLLDDATYISRPITWILTSIDSATLEHVITVEDQFDGIRIGTA